MGEENKGQQDGAAADGSDLSFEDSQEDEFEVEEVVQAASDGDDDDWEDCDDDNDEEDARK